MPTTTNLSVWWTDYILSGLTATHTRLVSEPSPVPRERFRGLAADYPISDVFTIPEVITLVLRQAFRPGRGSLSSKELPAI